MKKWFSIKYIGIILLIICLSGLIFANIEVRENQEPGEKINILEDETYKKYKKYLRHEDLSTGNRQSVKGQNHENGRKIESDASGDEVIGSNLTSVGETHYFPENEDGPKYEYTYFMKSLEEIGQKS